MEMDNLEVEERLFPMATVAREAGTCMGKWKKDVEEAEEEVSGFKTVRRWLSLLLSVPHSLPKCSRKHVLACTRNSSVAHQQFRRAFKNLLTV